LPIRNRRKKVVHKIRIVKHPLLYHTNGTGENCIVLTTVNALN